MKTMITGGVRSGKSSYALRLASGYAHRGFIATAEARDEEMRARIAEHKAARGGEYLAVEEGIDLAGAVRGLPGTTEVAVIDCLTLWLSNLMERYGPEHSGAYRETDDFMEVLRRPPCDLVIVTNETGMGIVPANALARRFRDLAGALNRRVAEYADEVVFMVSGLPLRLKGAGIDA